MAKKLRSLLRGAARVHLPSSEPGRALCRARGTQDPDRYKVTCRRCIKLDEINAGKRKGRRPKKFGQKFRQQLLLGGERRNSGWTLPGVSIETSQNGRLNLRKTDDKRLPWVVVDLQDEQKVYMSDSKSKALAAMHKLAAESYRTASDDVREAEHRERAVRMIEGAREHARRIESGEITRGPVIAGVQMWRARENPPRGFARRNGSPRNIEHGLERARYIQQDAHEALLLAAERRDMRGVKKYADQLQRAQDAQQELERAMSYVGKAQRKRHITGSWRTEDRLKDVGLAEWRQRLAGQSVGRALAKLRPNGRGHDPADREQAIGQLRALGMPLDEAVANLDGARKDGYSYSSVVRWARRHYEADRDNAMGGAFGPAD